MSRSNAHKGITAVGLLAATLSLSTAAPPQSAPPPRSRATALPQPTLGRVDVALSDSFERRLAAPLLAEARDVLATRLDVDALPESAELVFFLVATDGERPRLAGLTVRGAEQGDFTALREEQSGRVTFFDEDGASLDGPMLARPVEYRRIASRLGPRENPFGKKRPPKFHAGTDYAAPIGTMIRSIADGVVSQVGFSWRAGRYVFIRHDDGLEARYLHLSKREPGLKMGKRVRMGEPIGQVGQSGRVTGAHLHFELREDGLPLDAAALEMPSASVLDARALADHRGRMALFFAVQEDGRFDLTDDGAAWLFRAPTQLRGPLPVPRSADAKQLPQAIAPTGQDRSVRIRPARRPRRRRRVLFDGQARVLPLPELVFAVAPGGSFLTT